MVFTAIFLFKMISNANEDEMRTTISWKNSNKYAIWFLFSPMKNFLYIYLPN